MVVPDLILDAGGYIMVSILPKNLKFKVRKMNCIVIFIHFMFHVCSATMWEFPTQTQNSWDTSAKAPSDSGNLTLCF